MLVCRFNAEVKYRVTCVLHCLSGGILSGHLSYCTTWKHRVVHGRNKSSSAPPQHWVDYSMEGVNCSCYRHLPHYKGSLCARKTHQSYIHVDWLHHCAHVDREHTFKAQILCQTTIRTHQTTNRIFPFCHVEILPHPRNSHRRRISRNQT